MGVGGTQAEQNLAGDLEGNKEKSMSAKARDTEYMR